MYSHIYHNNINTKKISKTLHFDNFRQFSLFLKCHRLWRHVIHGMLDGTYRLRCIFYQFYFVSSRLIYFPDYSSFFLVDIMIFLIILHFVCYKFTSLLNSEVLYRVFYKGLQCSCYFWYVTFRTFWVHFVLSRLNMIKTYWAAFNL